MKRLLIFFLVLLFPFLIAEAQTGFIDTGNVGGENPTFYGNKTVKATFGTDLITWTAAGWDEDGATWTFAASTLTHVTGNTTAVTGTVTGALTAGVTYKVIITGTGGGATATYTLGGVTGTTIAASGAIAIEDYITATADSELVITPANTCTVALTLVSVKALTDATGDLTVDGNLTVRSPILGRLLVPAGTHTIPSIASSSNPNVGFSFGANTINFEAYNGGYNTLGYISGSGIFLYGSSFALGASGSISWYNEGTGLSGFRSGTTQQAIRVYNTAASATSNYERLAITGVQGASLNLTAETNGTGADNLDIVLTPAGTGQIKTTLSDDNGGHAITINANQAGVTASDTFMDFRSTTGSEGTIVGTAVAGTLAYNTFTGSHYTKIIDKPQDILVGTVLEMTGNLIGEWPDKSYIETIDVVKIVPFIVKSTDEEGGIVEKPLLDKTGQPETYQVIEKKDILHDLRAAPKQYLAESRICATKGSKAIYGVYGGTDKEGRDMVLALGTGVILVINAGKNIEVGDFLISSNTKGHAELQGDDFYQNSTIAKAAQNVVWKAGEISRLIACVYLGG